MATQKVTVTLDSASAGGTLFNRGSVRILPSARIPDETDQLLLEVAPVRVSFPKTGGPPTVDLFPCDLIGPQGDDGPGWSYTVYYDGCPGNPASWSFQLLSTDGSEQRLSSLAEAPVVQSGTVAVTTVNGKTGAVVLTASDTGAASTSALATEVTRAEAAETTLTTAVSDEVARAEAAESALSTAVTGETTRAEAAEALALRVVATTGAAGFALQNGTPDILTWNVPDDGQLHRCLIVPTVSVGSAETGGDIGVSFTMPDGSGVSFTVVTGGQGFGGFGFSLFNPPFAVKAGTTVTVSQKSALTAGSAKAWIELLGL